MSDPSPLSPVRLCCLVVGVLLAVSGCGLRARPTCVAVIVDQYVIWGTSDRRKVNKDGVALRRVVFQAGDTPTWMPEAWMEVGDGPCRKH